MINLLASKRKGHVQDSLSYFRAVNLKRCFSAEGSEENGISESRMIYTNTNRHTHTHHEARTEKTNTLEDRERNNCNHSYTHAHTPGMLERRVTTVP